jgi:hypothetical protein
MRNTDEAIYFRYRGPRLAPSLSFIVK